MRQPYQDELLDQHLRAVLGDLPAEVLAPLRQALRWVELAGGETLMTQGEPGDCLYLSISGRLRAYVRDDDGRERAVREMARGQVIGEMALFTDEPRSATVVAIRDSVLVQLSRSAFERLLGASAQASIALTRRVIQRLRKPQTAADFARPVTLALLPVTAGVDVPAFAQALAAQLRRQPGASRVCIVDAAGVEAALHASADSELEAERRIALYLDRIEAEHEFVLLLGDDGPTPWTRRCCRRSDEMLLLADADAAPVLHPIETELLMHRPGRSEAAEILVLLHPAERRCPQGTRAWLDRRPLTDHVHIRPALARDMARLARLQSRNAIGLVLAGGGARGLSHLGLLQALQAQGIEIDCVGGTSIGAVMAALIASDQPPETVVPIARRAFIGNPTGDFNPVPLLSLIRGRRLKRVMDAAAFELFGTMPDLEDLWKTCYCVASNYSQAHEAVLRRGSVSWALTASTAIPGALPPVLYGGELLCDGGTFNNFPVDVMRAQRGVGRVIGADLSYRKLRPIELDEVPSPWALLLDRLRPRGRRRYRLPSLVGYLMNVSVLYSASRQRQSRALTDLYFNPHLPKVGMLQWRRFDHIVQLGRAHAQEVLAALTPQALRPYRDAVALPPEG
ncbi:MAG: cyclic nucleotide-binding domain-containing protein [Burkholderiales bacterium]|nr:cyclic nucleotide-binding domain-containing protein [Burkholderiales bacterium]